MAASSFDAVFAFTMREEGGAKYTDIPGDTGGPTRWGVTLATLASWRRKPCSAADVEALGQDEAEAIFSARYWTPCHGDDLPAGADLVVVDMAYNAGPRRSALLLQGVLGVAEDGLIGPATLAAVRAQDTGKLVNRLTLAQQQWYQTLAGWRQFGRGWTNRVEARRTAALAMIGQAAPASKGLLATWASFLTGAK